VVIAVVNTTNFAVREAEPKDLQQIVSLINRAFDVERFFKAGDRTDAETVRENMSEGTFLVMLDGDEMIACVWIRITGDRAYLGTLSVGPSRQKSGIGARMMQEAEAYAREQGCSTICAQSCRRFIANSVLWRRERKFFPTRRSSPSPCIS
jgi:N-acetylglutamate synthase-like GNAT family acetyltransferase